MNDKRVTVNVLGPLLIGDPKNPDNPASRAAWERLKRQLEGLKELGVHALSTDVWWGIVAETQGQYNWSYYDRVAQLVTAAGLQWVPILSFHRCGGNIGDDAYVGVPAWVWGTVASKAGSSDNNVGRFLSEQGNVSHEYVSVWATDLIIEEYAAFMRAFQEHFADKARSIAEVNVSLGPSGELRFPSYNSHDRNSDYPRRGALQAYSSLALASFRRFALAKYGDVRRVGEAWGVKLSGENEIRPPDDCPGFFARRDHVNIQYGRDFFDWYSDSLLEHGRKVLHAALEVFASEEAPFKGIDVGAKVPGVHWRLGERAGSSVVLGDRLAELAAGLIRTSGNDWGSDQEGRGYRFLVSMFRKLQEENPDGRLVLHFTCLEMPDGQDGPEARSLPHTLAGWFGQEARRQGVPLKGENALWWNLYTRHAWQLMRSLLRVEGRDAAYQGLTLLRVGYLLNNEISRSELARTVELAEKANQASAGQTGSGGSTLGSCCAAVLTRVAKFCWALLGRRQRSCPA